MNTALSQLHYNTCFQKTVLYMNITLEIEINFCPAIAKHVYRDKDFRFVSVHVWNYISKNISIDVCFPSFKKSLKLFIFSEDFNFKI